MSTPAPWTNPSRLGSLWELLEISFSSLIESIHKSLAGIVRLTAIGQQNPPYELNTKRDEEELRPFLAPVRELQDLTDRLRLTTTNRYIRDFFMDLERGMTVKQLTMHIEMAVHLLRLETETAYLLFLEADEGELYSASPIDEFGDEVCNGFPSILGDLEEAMKCLALSRATSCVFHLMRVLEAVSGAICVSLGIDISKMQGWGDYRKAVADYLENKNKEPRPLDWKQREPFYLEAHAHLTAVYKAWRNPTMHMEKTYTVSHAEAIFNSVKGLLLDVAEHIDETGAFHLPKP